MSNSPLVTYTKLSPNCTKPRRHKIDTVTIHCMAAPLSVESCGAGFADPARKASSNYGIGPDGRIALYVDESNRSWCSSNPSNDHRAITIEVASDSKHPYVVTAAAYNALIDLLTDICKRNGIPRLLWRGDKSLVGQVEKQNMTVHRWFAAKACPGDYLYERHGAIAEAVNNRLNPKEGDKLTQEQFNRMADEYFYAKAKEKPQEWSKPFREWAEENDLILGTDTGAYKYMAPVTREELVTLMYRFYTLVKK